MWSLSHVPCGLCHLCLEKYICGIITYMSGDSSGLPPTLELLHASERWQHASAHHAVRHHSHHTARHHHVWDHGRLRRRGRRDLGSGSSSGGKWVLNASRPAVKQPKVFYAMNRHNAPFQPRMTCNGKPPEPPLCAVHLAACH